MDLRQVLRSFCVKTGWCYSVFWKLKHGSSRALTWGDGFYECDPAVSCFNPNNGASVSETSNTEIRIKLALAKMSSCHYSMGEGIIGQVASTGKSQWVFADGERSNISGGSVAMLGKYPSSWDEQFAAGIKTIAIIAVPQGVVQLGSTRILMENMEWTNRVESAFLTLQNMSQSHFSDLIQGVQAEKIVGHGLNGNSGFVEEEKSKNSKRYATENHAGISHLMPQKLKIMQVGKKGVEGKAHNFNTEILESSSSALHLDMVADASQGTPLSTQDMIIGQSEEVRSRHLENNCMQPPFITGLQKVLGSEIGTNGLMNLGNDRFLGPKHGANQLNVDELLYKIILDSESSISGTSVKGYDSQQPKLAFNCNPNIPVPASSCYNMQNNLLVKQNPFCLIGKDIGDHESPFGSTFDDVSQSTCSGGGCWNPNIRDMITHSESTGRRNDDSFGCKESTHIAQGRNGKSDRSFMIGDELSEALGPAFKIGHVKDSWEDGSKKMGATHYLLDQTMVEKEYWSVFEGDSESLLDAVVANASSSHHSVTTADESVSCKTMSGVTSQMPPLNAAKESVIKHPRCSYAQDCHSQDFVKALPSDCSGDTHSILKMIQDPIGRNSSVDGSQVRSIVSSWSDDMQSMKSDSTQSSQSKKPDDSNRAMRKRARPGESTRPRPKDRQQIQDRVRELREIIPNGSKCSIDALLEKTIKHMIFLQNVTLHVDNLKNNGELRDGMESGASWAFELRGEETDHPILVKNLNQPRQLLIEMFCEERSHFLEIADVIRSLGLSILKGVMESHSGKIWARFIVEGNKDVRRVDIMMSLMHRFHINDNSISSMTMASQSVPLRSQQAADSTSSSQTQTLCGLQQAPLHS